ncbi:MAG: cytochrome oxidase small assembly protein [Rubrivivax sp.]
MARAVTREDDERRRRANVRLALILAGVALAFGVGFVARLALYGR